MSAARAELRPREHVHRGTVRAWAFWFAPALLGEAEARRRILGMWTPDMFVRAVAGGYLVGMSAPREVRCAVAPGLPFTLEQGVLTAAPLSPAERRHASLHEGAGVLVLGGQVQVFTVEALPRVDVAAWLDVSEWTYVDTRTLAAPPPPVVVLERVLSPPRARFGPAVPEPSPEAQAMFARMEGRELPAAAVVHRPGLWARLRARFAPAGAVTRAGPGRPGWWARFRAALTRGGTSGSAASGTPGLLARWLGRFRKPPEDGALQAPPPPSPQGPSAWSQLTGWMMRNTLLGVWVQQRKAEYVRRLFEMFEEGNLHEALRHAIPLGNGLSETARMALGLPGPREQLTLRLGPNGPGTVFVGEPDVFAALQQRYREAFHRFEREGRVDEAAFVLAELLGAHEEAVSFLEKAGRFQLAAELAESRKLAPGLVVRQWLLAKDVARAVAVARRSGAFSDAVARLERTNPAEARELRLHWAETLAASGDFARAVQVVWPVPESRERAREWLERGVAAGGATGARLLALWATSFSDGLTGAGARIRELLEEEGVGRASERFVFGLALMGEPPSAQRAALAVPTLRALLRDRAAGNARFTSDLDLIKRLLSAAPDDTLRADLPALPDCVHPAWRDDRDQPRVDVTLRAAEAGTFTLHDAVVLPDGGLLYALGEAGVRWVRADGRRVARFDVPAFHLVPSLHGDRALALARRGDVWRLSRVDLSTRRGAFWCDAKVHTWAPVYDGNVWFASVENTVLMVDPLAADFRALWRVTDLPLQVSAMAADSVHLSFLAGYRERWTYTLDQGPTLRSRVGLPFWREDAPFSMSSLDIAAVTPDGETAARLSILEPPEDSPRLLGVGPHSARRAVRPSFDSKACSDIHLTPSWCVQLMEGRGAWRVEMTDKWGLLRAVLTFQGDVRPQVRLTEDTLLAFDAAGRGLWVDLEGGEVRHLPVP
ncbi:bpX6 domain-containing protein [Comamonas sp. JC664]|uniref:bpX6 domain-containing protein n=1 Tax=Comamonas sp. JC664 TaxID=2801917 RepID=UPI00174BE106|nr:bpX6 domain-containing protein [Comamonas sp. JC664]MBL0698844.1 hypothetical protein [Comamonas sp. JC664]GHG79193.1 hypothetical protein GCM10012319_30730 [Comamonas sp. KCTC 72670]